MALRYIVPALAIASGAAAATCSVAGTTTVTNTVQASSLASCPTFSGSIAIATGAAAIALDGIDKITGDLVAADSSTLTSLSADSLTTIEGAFMLTDCTILSALTFPDLTSVGSIKWVGLAGLYGLSFSSNIQTADTVFIENTELESLDGIELTTVASMSLLSNRYLTSVDMGITNITATNGLSVSSNGRDFALTLSSLASVKGDLNIHNVTTLNIDSLSSVTGTLGFYDNFFTSISCPNLTAVGKELAIVGNADLTTVTMDELRTIEGGFLISNNTLYKDVDFPKLETVGGAIDFVGTFTEVSLPALETVRGAFTLKSTKDISKECAHFKSIEGSNNVIEGTFVCDSGDSTATTATGGSATSAAASASASSTKSSSASSSVYASGATGILGVIAAIFGLL